VPLETVTSALQFGMEQKQVILDIGSNMAKRSLQMRSKRNKKQKGANKGVAYQAYKNKLDRFET
jgi:hypothetical protein